MVKAVVITSKGVQFKPDLKFPFVRWPPQNMLPAAFSKYHIWTSEDACSKTTSADHWFRLGTKSPGTWNVYVSKQSFAPTRGFYWDTYPNLNTMGGSNLTFAIVDENWSGITESGCSAEMPISDADMIFRVNMRSIDGSRNVYGAHVGEFTDDFGTKRVLNGGSSGAMEGVFRVTVVPGTWWCSWFR